MEITGMYYRTLLRDEKTGKTTFDFTPNKTEGLPTVDGLLRCFGIIGVYAKNIPLCLEGDFNNSIFSVRSCIVETGTRESAFQFLEYAAGELTDLQKRLICDLAKDDFIAFAKSCSDSDMKRLTEISGERRIAATILKKAKKAAENESMVKMMLEVGIPADVAVSICEKDITEEQLKKDPYSTILFHGLTAFHADNLVRNQIKAYAPVRISGYIMDAVVLSEKSGNTCIKVDDLVRLVNTRMKKSIYPEAKINISLLVYSVKKLLFSQVCIEICDGTAYLYRKKALEEEESLIQNIKRLNAERSQVPIEDVQTVANELKVSFAKGQEDAFELIKTTGVKVLTGPPGSGKTTVIRGLIQSFKGKNPYKEIALAATTGRASQVLSEACSIPACTVHRLIDIRPYGDNLSAKNQNNPLSADLIIVDECSMMGLQLADMLFQAVKTGATILLVGDADQLSSVEYGNVFNDLIESGYVEVCRLTEVFRQNGEFIYENGQRINEGRQELIENADFIIEKDINPMNVRHILLKESDPRKDLILTPVNGTELGIHELNKILQKKVIDTAGIKPIAVYGQTCFYPEDKVIMCETNYRKGYFNGETGDVIGRSADGEILVSFRDKVLSLGREDLRHMELAYARTIHRLQGSEARKVFIILPKNNMLTRRLLYTAVTRAIDTVHILPESDSVQIAISNVNERKRCSLLAAKLGKLRKDLTKHGK